MADQPRELRIGDAERTAAADELAEHYAQGRLTADEHGERLDRIWAARTRADLVPVFADLPGSAYQRPSAYPTADGAAVGSDRPGRRQGRPGGGTRFPSPPFGRPPLGRPPYAGSRRVGVWFGPLPALLKLLLAAALVVLVVTHLPLILIGLLVWVVLARGGICRPRRAYQRR